MALSNRTKVLIWVALLAIVLFGGCQAARVWWYRAYSKGTRTGVVRKLSVKGPPYCKYLSGELVLTGAQPGQAPETWEFSIDDDSEDNPLVAQLQQAEKSGDRVTLRYRQDLHSLYRCTPSEYFVTAVER